MHRTSDVSWFLPHLLAIHVMIMSRLQSNVPCVFAWLISSFFKLSMESSTDLEFGRIWSSAFFIFLFHCLCCFASTTARSSCTALLSITLFNQNCHPPPRELPCTNCIAIRSLLSMSPSTSEFIFSSIVALTFIARRRGIVYQSPRKTNPYRVLSLQGCARSLKGLTVCWSS